MVFWFSNKAKAWTTKLTWTIDSFQNFQNTILKDISIYFHRVTKNGLKPLQFFSFKNISTNMVARGIQSFGQKWAMTGRQVEQLSKFLHQIIWYVVKISARLLKPFLNNLRKTDFSVSTWATTRRNWSKSYALWPKLKLKN